MRLPHVVLGYIPLNRETIVVFLIKYQWVTDRRRTSSVLRYQQHPATVFQLLQALEA